MSRRRLLVGVGLLALMVGLSGCTLLGPGSVNEGDLASDPGGGEYEWGADTDAYLEVNRNNYTAVYRVGARSTGNLEPPYTMELYERDALGTDQPIDPTALQFRYENGSRLRFVSEDGSADLVMVRENGSRVDVPEEKLVVNKTRRRTRVFLPTNETGQLAFTAPKNGKQLATPTLVRGSHELVLPRGTSVGLPVLSQVSPSASRTETIDGRVHVFWENVDRAPTLVVRYYLNRDLTLFGGMVALLVVLGSGGALYYYRQIRETVRKREEVGLDTEVGEDSGGDDPPGFG